MEIERGSERAKRGKERKGKYIYKPAPARALSLNVSRLNKVGGIDVYLKPHPLPPGRYLWRFQAPAGASRVLEKEGAGEMRAEDNPVYVRNL